MSSHAQILFPSTDSDSASMSLPVSPQSFVAQLPFRRISLPAAPNLHLNRQSVVSLASFESLSEYGTSQGPIASPTKELNSRPASMEARRKGVRRRGYRAPDKERDAKRGRVIQEFYETERTYVQGLDLIYELFLTPIIAALDTSHSLLSRADLTSVFSNFIDIWNLHRAFFTSLHEHLHPTITRDSQQSLPSSPPPHLSPVLLSHFPYLSLYTPFVTSFGASLAALTTLINTNPAFSAFVARQEAELRCGKLKLRDWLLTIVQRCPRYLLLLKDLMNCTDTEHPEYSSLMTVHALVAKITTSMNASLHTHAQTLGLLALQRSTPNLPFQLIAPGRTFLKRGSLIQLDRGSFPKERDFLLFSDCLVWIANLGKGDSEVAERWGVKVGPSPRIMMVRSRSRSEAELSALRRNTQTSGVRHRFLPTSQPTSPTCPSPSAPRNRSFISQGKRTKRHASSASCDERWWYKGKAELVDLEIVVTPPSEVGEDCRFEVWSPEGSFAVYAANEGERDEWSTAIRNAKAALLASLNVTRPNSTLSSSASTNHLRRRLQALPHLPEDVQNSPRRGRVEHFVPAVWIPDGRTESCMRCGRSFGWRRRRHHCRLCGRCVCASCSGSTFYIFDSDVKGPGKSARACDACYDTVFPVLTPSPSSNVLSSMPSPTLSNFPSWQSTPALALTRPPSLLMAFDRGSSNRELVGTDDAADGNARRPDLYTEDGREKDESTHPVIRLRPASRPRSFIQILEDFQEENLQVTPSPSTSHFSAQTDESADVVKRSTNLLSSGSSAPSVTSLSAAPTSLPTSSVTRIEDTARRQQRFSLPIVGLQTTPVTARANAKGEGLGKRFSLVLGGGRTVRGPKSTHAHAPGLNQEIGDGTVKQSRSTGHGVAALWLTDLLGRRKDE
ncbi:hypothetical protein F5148DRAFT_1158583 [Russula earlei]|uniref:Uncharacterized protein n=1 Tax=Russula earlei TaxID=71964 RepID=A0ACC0UNA7_9AGAM|nr:hypothetical protein F5148DRAFT_1158583 [Russula earlei]